MCIRVIGIFVGMEKSTDFSEVGRTRYDIQNACDTGDRSSDVGDSVLWEEKSDETGEGVDGWLGCDINKCVEFVVCRRAI